MSADRTALKNVVVRILSVDGEFLGLGYRVSKDITVTCAHVLAKILDSDKLSVPQGKVSIDFPFGGYPGQAYASVVPEGWLPPRKDKLISDIAILRLTPPFPDLVPPAPLHSGISLTGHTFLSYGGLKGHELHLAPLEGRVGADIGSGRYYLHKRDRGYDIEPGCSGAPVFSATNGSVLGLIAQDEEDPNIGGGFLIPASHLRKALAQAGIEFLLPPGLGSLRSWINQSLHGAGLQLADQVKRFVDYYSGAPDRPMPFSGRDDVISDLAGELAASGGSFLLVTGAAGLGKSAFLLHLMSRVLGGGEEVYLIFLPISIRFDTADELRGLKILYVQLARFFADVAFEESFKPDQEDYRDRIAAGWERIANQVQTRFVLVIDGADEASGDWIKNRVLPYTIPSNLIVIVAARYKPGDRNGDAWLAEFDFAPACTRLKPLDLRPLSKKAVADALAQLGHPLDGLPEQDGILDALYRLTDGGDPLLINLWVSQLWHNREQAAALRVPDLKRLEPSFTGFLNIWMKEQESIWKSRKLDIHPDDFQRLLHVLALARGPLRLKDLLALTDLLDFPKSWNLEHTRNVIENASRLVAPVADDAGHKGYAFVHPRLGNHFRNALEAIKGERQAVSRTYLDWGKATVAALNQNTLLSEQCPPYLLHHYVTHVLEADLAPDEMLEDHLLPLLDVGWHRAWHEEEGSYSGYTSDLRRVRDTLQHVNLTRSAPPYRVGQELRCVLILSSIRSWTSNLKPQLIVALVKAGVWTVRRGVRVAGAKSEPVDQTTALVGLAELLIGERRRQVLAQALEAAQHIHTDTDRAQALAAAARQLIGAPDLLERIIVSAASVTSEASRGTVLAAAAGQLPEEGKLVDQVLQAANNIHSEEDRARVIVAVAEQSTGESELPEKVLQAAESLSPASHGRVLQAVARQLKGENRERVLRQVIQVASRIDEEGDRAELLAAAAEQSTENSELLGEILRAARLIDGFSNRAHVLVAVAKHLTGQSEILNQVLQEAETIGDQVEGFYSDDEDGWRFWRLYAEDYIKVLAASVKQLSGTDRARILGLALQAALAINDEETRAQMMMALAEQLSGEDRKKLLRLALIAARSVPDQRSRAMILAVVAEGHSGKDRARILGLALQAALASNDEETRAETLMGLATRLSGEEQQQALGCALLAACKIVDERDRARVLAAVAPQLAPEPKLLNLALQAAYEIRNEKFRSNALLALAEQLADRERRQAVYQALQAARTIGDNECCAHALAVVADQLTGEDRDQALHEAIQAASGIPDKETQAKALVAVAKRVADKERRQALLGKVLQTARNIACERARVELLVSVAGQSQGECELLSQVLQSACDVGDEWERAQALSSVARELSSESKLLVQVLQMARNIGHDGYRAHALAAIAKQLAGKERRRALAQALHAARCTRNESYRAKVLAAVAGQLRAEDGHEALRQAVQSACTTRNEEHRAKLLVAVAEQSAGKSELLGKILEAARLMANGEYRAHVLAVLARQLGGQPELLNQALQAAGEIENHWYRAGALAAVAEQMAGQDRRRALGQALKAARKIEHKGARAEALAVVAEQMAGQDRRRALWQALEAARNIGDEEYRAEVLAEVAAREMGAERWKALGDAMEAACRVRRERGRVDGLARIAKHLAFVGQKHALGQPGLALDCADAVRVHCDERDRYNILTILSGELMYLPRDEVLMIVELLVPVLVALGGTSSMRETFEAIRDSVRWWP